MSCPCAYTSAGSSQLLFDTEEVGVRGCKGADGKTNLPKASNKQSTSQPCAGLEQGTCKMKAPYLRILAPLPKTRHCPRSHAATQHTPALSPVLQLWLRRGRLEFRTPPTAVRQTTEGRFCGRVSPRPGRRICRCMRRTKYCKGTATGPSGPSPGSRGASDCLEHQQLEPLLKVAQVRHPPWSGRYDGQRGARTDT